MDDHSPLSPPDAGPPSDNPLQILLIEDDPTAAALVREMLALVAPGAAVRHAFRLAEALDAPDYATADAIVLDLSLPDAQGLHGLAVLRAAAPRVPVVILTANTDEELARHGVQAGAQNYLVKGRVTPESLLRALRYAVERQRSNDRLTYLAFHDDLTGLPNRTLLEDRLNHALAHARRHSGRVAVLFLDLDGFKAINDHHGHDVGDLLLREVAARLVGCTRACDTAARLAGDEFVVLLPESDRAAASTVAAKVLSVVGAPYFLAETIPPAGITVSVGISIYPTDGTDAAALIRRADLAMYEVKRSGRNAFTFAHADMPSWTGQE